MNSDLSTSKLNFWHWITSELSERMAQNLPFIKISPQKILLVGEFQKSTFTYFQKIIQTPRYGAIATRWVCWRTIGICYLEEINVFVSTYWQVRQI